MDDWIDRRTAERTNKQTNVLFSYGAVFARFIHYNQVKYVNILSLLYYVKVQPAKR